MSDELLGTPADEAEALEEAKVLEEPKRHPLKFLIRIAIGIGVVGVLIWRTPDRSELLDAFSGATPGWAIAAGVALFVGIIASAARWSAYLRALEIPLRFSTVLRLYFVGTFFNSFLPSGIGGDAYKGVRIGKRLGRYTPGFASIFLDRFAGFIALAAIGLFGALIELFAYGGDRVSAAAAVLSAGMMTAALLVLFAGERMLGSGRLVKRQGTGEKLRVAIRAIHAAARHRDAAARGYLFGLVFQLLVLTYHLLLARALGITGVSIAAMTGVVVVSSLAALIPLSPGGLGFREVAYTWALGTFGVEHATALAFALLVLAILLATSAVGGLIYVVAGGEVRVEVGRR
jgi:uncharacterized protein (TIRG00374 family)